MNRNSPRMVKAKARLKEAMKPYRPSNKVTPFNPKPLTEEQRKAHEEQDAFLHGPKDGLRILAQRDPNWTGD